MLPFIRVRQPSASAMLRYQGATYKYMLQLDPPDLGKRGGGNQSGKRIHGGFRPLYKKENAAN